VKNRNVSQQIKRIFSFPALPFGLGLFLHRKNRKQTTLGKLLTLFSRSFFIHQNFFLVSVYFRQHSIHLIPAPFFQRFVFYLGAAACCFFLCAFAPAQKAKVKLGGSL
jgi:hypothetical protein